jgi:hypothetical protein
MVNYSCEICNKIFIQKTHYNQHKKIKTECNNNDEKLKNIINQVIDDKINLLIDNKKIELNIFNNIINNDNKNIIVAMNNKEIVINNEIVNNDKIIVPISVNKKKNKLSKQILGQFYTTNQEYILQGMKIPDNIKNIIEPFTGNGDLITFIEKEQEKNNVKYIIECYDIEPKKNYIIQRDTIKDPPDYKNKYLITNPPYLARNKSKDKSLFDKYDVNDLYKCVIKYILTNICLGGIFIIPLNFWSSIRLADIELRKAFLEKYDVILLNIFEEQVFDDTTYTICSFQFELKKNNDNSNKLNIIVYPSKTIIKTELNDNNNFMIGGDIYNLKLNNTYKITRLTNKNKAKSNTNILVKCIDDNIKSQIGLSFVEDKDIYIDNTPNQTARTYATLIIEPKIDKDKQKQLITKFNKYLEEHRKKYNSLFLTNYRESKDIARKRISFDLVYSITEFILDNFNDI